MLSLRKNFEKSKFSYTNVGYVPEQNSLSMPFIMESYQVISCVNVDVVSDVSETAIITEIVSETSDTNVITSMPDDGDRDSL
jgi:hypothetical protein